MFPNKQCLQGYQFWDVNPRKKLAQHRTKLPSTLQTRNLGFEVLAFTSDKARALPLNHTTQSERNIIFSQIVKMLVKRDLIKGRQIELFTGKHSSLFSEFTFTKWVTQASQGYIVRLSKNKKTNNQTNKQEGNEEGKQEKEGGNGREGELEGRAGHGRAWKPTLGNLRKKNSKL